MPSLQQHYSTVTNQWSTCKAVRRGCRYATHRDVADDDDTDRTALADVFYKTNLPKTVSLLSNKGKVENMLVAEEGTTGKRCRGCDKILSAETIQQIDSSQAGASANCEHCGHKMNWYAVEPPYIVEVNRAEAHLLQNRETAKKQTWFHGTTVDNWAAEIAEAGVFIHAGTNNAALERLKISGQVSNEQQYVYELRMKPETQVNSTVYWDDNHFPESLNHHNDNSVKRTEVALYVNQWESPGSVSIIGAFDKFEVVNMHRMNPATGLRE